MAEAETCDLLCLDAPLAERVRRALPAAATIELLARAAKAYGDPTRLTIALALREAGRACCCDIGFVVARDEKLVSHHLRALKAAALARSQPDGKMVMYELTDAGIGLLDAVAGTRTAAAEALAR